MERCYDCPRRCGAERETALGRCHAPREFLVSRVSLHMWEEPPISGTRGSGAVFFGGCNLGCVFCQNRAIRDGQLGERLRADELERAAWRLVEEGAHNLNLVTPTHYVRALVPFLARIRPRLPVPVVWNSGGYESVESLRMLDGLVDVYLPDFKYADPSFATRYSAAPDYPEVAAEAVREMFRQRGAVTFDEDGLIKSGVIVRHLVLPGGRRDSEAVLDRLASLLPIPDVRLSLMSQFTPEFVDKTQFPELARRVTTFEYQRVLSHAMTLGFDGYFQTRDSATAAYTPDFTELTIKKSAEST